MLLKELLKLCVRNVRRSVRDYALYFFTLVFAIAVFYVFGAIGDQQVLFDLKAGDAAMFDTTQQLLSVFSVVVAVVLGFLVVYANRFIARRRRREFGIYLMLGMTSRDVSLIVVGEALVVGVASLAAGLVAGIVLSQGMAFATAALFDVQITNYRFVLSADALRNTLACFAVVYVVVALANVVAVRRYRIVDLMASNVRNERPPVRNPWISAAGMVAAIALIAKAYALLIENGMEDILEPSFMWATVLMIAGTLVFFWALSGLAVWVLSHARGAYLRGLTPFTVRQVAAKANTAFASLWATCLLLFFTICTFSTGMGLIGVFYDSIEEAAPYDASVYAWVWSSDGGEFADDSGDPYTDIDARAQEIQANYPETYTDAQAYGWDMAAKLADVVPGWSDLAAATAQVDLWAVPESTYADLFASADTSVTSAAYSAANVRHVQVMGLSQYNGLRALLGQDAVALEGDEFCVLNNITGLDEASAAVASAGEIKIMGQTLYGTGEVFDTQFTDSASLATSCVLVVPDAVVDGLRAGGALPIYSYLQVEYPQGMTREAGDAALRAGLAAAFPVSVDQQASVASDTDFQSGQWPVSQLVTAQEMQSQAGGLRMMIVYLALYLGLAFLMTTAAVLAIQQLTEAADSQGRYRALARLGCDDRMIARSVFAQVLVYFAAPLAVAICHAACAVGVMSDTLFAQLGVDLAGPIGAAAAFVLVIYGAYFAVTYLGARRVALT